MLKLVISDNEGTTTVVPLVRDEVSIGRQDGNTIRLTERNISRRHAKLSKVNGHYEISDLGSYNGLVLNGQRVASQTKLSSGDQVQIGDYTISVQSEAMPAVTEEEATRVVAAPQQTPPARVVMLVEPTPGAEFSLPAAGVAKLGRSEELSIPINHRSVSREHAEISREGDDYILMDLASANGVSVNGRKVEEQVLASGDIIELGQVMFRFVAAGEQYAFDPAEAAQHARAHGGASAQIRIALALVAVAAAIAVGIMSGGSDDETVVTAGVPVAPAPEAAAAAADPYDEALAACSGALQGGRFAEAVAHSGLALKARPADGAALECQARAQRGHEDEQAFVRGEAALGSGDPEAAHLEFSRLAADSAFRSRPPVAEALAQVSSTRVARARSLLAASPAEAQRLAAGVLALPGISPVQVQAAEAIVDEARRLQQLPAEAVAVHAPAAAPRKRRPAAAARAKVAPTKAAPAARKATAPKPRRAASKPAKAAGPSPMRAASACLAKGDNQCVVKALAGKARTAQEMGLLIETYRAMGNTQAARKYMTLYVKRFPSAKRANSYRRMLEQ